MIDASNISAVDVLQHPQAAGEERIAIIVRPENGEREYF